MTTCYIFSLSLLLLFLITSSQSYSLNDAKPKPSRRAFLVTAAAIPVQVAAGGFIHTSNTAANAIPLFEKKERRQLELCLVNVLRLQYWARTLSDTLDNSQSEDERKKAYLEARLGAKAMVAEKQKIGGGASLLVLTLKGLQMKECLDDLKYYAKSKQMDQYKDDLIEALASLVEFDGLETTQDPSPRSSLTLGMYTKDKSIFVRRMLSERIAPLTDDIVDVFGRDQKLRCEQYIEQSYPSELPPPPRQQPNKQASLSAVESSTEGAT